MKVQGLTILSSINSKMQRNTAFCGTAPKLPGNANELVKQIDAGEPFFKPTEEGVNDYALRLMKYLKETFAAGDTFNGFKILQRIGQLSSDVVKTPSENRKIGTKTWISLNTLGVLDATRNPSITRYELVTKETVLRTIDHLEKAGYGEFLDITG